MINGYPINSAPINSAGGGEVVPPEPVVAGVAYVWRLRVIVGGVDYSARLTGGVDVDREEGSAAVAGFTLQLPPGPVVPTDWVGLPVSIDFIVTEQGVTTEHRRFTGWLGQPTWDPVLRILSCECSDNLQQRIEAMSVAEINALTPGYWTEDAFEPVAGRSHWDYAQERMSTVPASLDCDVYGTPRVSSWLPGAPALTFGAGSTLYESVEVELAEMTRITNRVELEAGYRYSRLKEFRQRFGWGSPEGDFCSWRLNNHELPTVDMFISAASAGGLTPIRGQFNVLPPTAPDPCGTGAAWINNEPDLVLSGGVTGARRWAQTVTETYRLTLRTQNGTGPGAVLSRAGQSFTVESPDAEGWGDSLKPLVWAPNIGSVIVRDPVQRVVAGDRDDEGRRVSFLAAELHAARTQILGAHRENSVSWAIPTPMAITADLFMSLELQDQGVHATGKCRRIVDAFDLTSGAAITTLIIAVMRGAQGASTPLTVPARLGQSTAPDPDPEPGVSVQTPTQLGGRFTSPEYDEEREGFSGNYSPPQDGSLEVFPRRLFFDAVEIPAAETDEQLFAGDYEYVVGIPNDILEM